MDMRDQETPGAVPAALLRFALAYVALDLLFRVLAAIAGGALPGTTIIILAASTVLARRCFHALRRRRPVDPEKIALLFGSFAIAMVAAGVIFVAAAIVQGYPEQSAGEVIDQLLRARPIDVLIVRYLLGGVAYFLIIWICYGPLLEALSTPTRSRSQDRSET